MVETVPGGMSGRGLIVLWHKKKIYIWACEEGKRQFVIAPNFCP